VLIFTIQQQNARQQILNIPEQLIDFSATGAFADIHLRPLFAATAKAD
jgi:hypothetical protein